MDRIHLLEEILRTHARIVDEAMRSYLQPSDGALAKEIEEYLLRGERRIRPSFAVFEPMRHVVEAGGKRVRPTLCLLSCEAVGGKKEQALPTAVGIEFLHTFTLVHDDVMDGDLVRRGRLTVGALWGNNVAITAGDALFALAFKAFASNASVPGVDPGRAVRVLGEAAETSLDLARGQTMDLLFESREDVTVEEYLEMVRLKTGVLLEFSLRSGAILGGGEEGDIQTISSFGAPLGIAFQIKDDLLGLVGDPQKTGKPVGSDLRAGKKTLPIVHALSSSPERERLLEILQLPRKEEKEIEEALGILKRSGSLEFARSVADRFLSEAKGRIEELPSTPGGRALEALGVVAEYVLRRES